MSVLNNHREFSAEEVAKETHLPRPVVVTFAHLDPVALGVALGIVLGSWLCVATMILVIRGGEVVGPNLRLIANYFIGYSVTWSGAIIGFLYGGVFGFLFGYLFAALRNFVMHLYLVLIRRRAEKEAIGDLL